MTRISRLSALTPLHHACNSALFYYRPDVKPDVAAASLGITVTAALTLAPSCLAALWVIITHGMRATEYLSATVRQILPGDRLLVFGAKGSGNYIVYLSGISSQLAHSGVSNPGIGVSGLYYMQLYRACVRSNLYRLVAGHRNLSRTHSGRYKLASEVLGFGTQIASDVLHHRTPRSISYYIGANGGSHGYVT